MVIIQSNYIPWKGYFDQIRAADEVILYDEVQYTRNDWRNRNQIKSAGKKIWLTIPVENSFRYLPKICDIRIADPRWPVRHWKTIQQNYARSAHFRDYAEELSRLYQSNREEMLSGINRRFIEAICRWLGISTRLRWSTEFPRRSLDRTGRLVELCQDCGATHYLSGPAAKAYLDEGQFSAQGIQVIYADYAGYPEYRQLHGAFDHYVSALDLLLNAGAEASKYLIDVARNAVTPDGPSGVGPAALLP